MPSSRQSQGEDEELDEEEEHAGEQRKMHLDWMKGVCFCLRLRGDRFIG